MGFARLWALDLDGTLLDADGRVFASTARAIELAHSAGVRVVLCTGRRYRRARDAAIELGLAENPLVCNSGALVKDPTTHATLWRADLSHEHFCQVVGLLQTEGANLIAFADRKPEELDFLAATESTGCAFFDEYVRINRSHAEIDAAWVERLIPEARFHVCAIGAREEMRRLEALVLEAHGSHVRTYVQKSPRYLGTMCEVVRADAGKWEAVLALGRTWGIAPAEICAVGDDENDLSMIASAGLGVAMRHAPEHVRAASRVILDPIGLGEYLQGLL
jgi:Cof subfamily protein (haloacid dehalogenase superfamily)